MTDKDLPPWIRLHVSMPDELADLSDRAFRLTIRLWCYCYRTGQFGTDGLVPRTILEEYARGSRAVITELVKADIVEPNDSGVLCRSYLKWQESAHDRADLHEKRREAGSRGGHAKAARVARAIASAEASASDLLWQTASKNVAEVEREIEKEKDQELPTGLEPAKSPSVARAKPRALRLDPGWNPDPADHRRMKFTDEQATEQLASFRDYWCSRGRDAARLDWQATWRNWLRNTDRRRAGTNGHKPSTTDQRVTAGLELADMLERKAIT